MHYILYSVKYNMLCFWNSCGTETECKEQWLGATSDRHECTDYDTSQLHLYPFECTYCCTSALCNHDLVPPKASLYVGQKQGWRHLDEHLPIFKIWIKFLLANKSSWIYKIFCKVIVKKICNVNRNDSPHNITLLFLFMLGVQKRYKAKSERRLIYFRSVITMKYMHFCKLRL